MVTDTINGIDMVITKTRKYLVYKDHLYFINQSGRGDEVTIPYGDICKTYFYALTGKEKSGNIE